MNRRSFFKDLALAASGIIMAPQIFLPKEPVKWKRTNNLYIPNPDYVDAEYEYITIFWPCGLNDLKSIIAQEAKIFNYKVGTI